MRVKTLNLGALCFSQRDQYSEGGGGGGGCIPYGALYGEAPPERGTFFRLQVHERVGISLVKV